MPSCRLFEPPDLLPAAWRRDFGDGPVRVFNPGVLRGEGGWILAYRVVGPDAVRRIGLCRLDPDLSPRPGSALPWSDAVRFPADAAHPSQALSWFADPRLYRLGDRLFVYWNSGWHEPHNCQFLQEIDARDLSPIGPPREMRLGGPRRALEKNWTLFGDGPFHALYAMRPQRILDFSLAGDGPIEFHDREGAIPIAAEAGNLADLRGGAPPQAVGPLYYAIGHYLQAAPGGYRYAAAVHRFGRRPPFAPAPAAAGPLLLPNPIGGGRSFERLNPAVSEVIYPCGADFAGGIWTVSYGINDERCAIAQLTQAEVLASLAPGT